MPSGGPDFGVAVDATVIPLDAGEVAIRQLSGAGGLYRGGNVIFSTVMQNGLAPFNYYGGLGGSAKKTKTTTYTEYGPAALKIVSTAVQGTEAYMGREMPTISASKHGLETSCLFTVAAAHRFIMRSVVYYADGRTHTYAVRINSDAAGTTLDVDYLKSDNTYTDLITLGLTSLGRGFQSFKLIYDNATKGTPKYVKFLYNGVPYDMSTLPAYTTTSANAYLPVTLTNVGVEPLSAVARTLYVGIYTFTINEP